MEPRKGARTVQVRVPQTFFSDDDAPDTRCTHKIIAHFTAKLLELKHICNAGLFVV